MGIVVDYLSNIGLDVDRDRITNSAIESAARDRLRDYLTRQKKTNEVCTREEEIDFERLANYIQEELILVKCIILKNKKVQFTATKFLMERRFVAVNS